jgi:hypothetical protein
MFRNSKVLLFFGVVLCSSLFCASWAFQNEPPDFRGIEWGARIDDLPDMKFLAAIGEVKSYQRESETLAFGKATVSSVSYIFYKGRFCSAYIGFEDQPSFDRIKKGLVQTYGIPYRPSEEMERYFWEGKRVDIALRYSEEPSQKGSIIYWFRPIMQEKIADDEERAARREAAYN